METPTLEAVSRRTCDLLQGIVETEIPGIQYVVVDSDSVLFNYSGGMRDMARRLPVTDSTTFLSSSTTKVLTAAGIMKLVDNGTIQLNDLLSTYYTEHSYGDHVQIKHLLNQSSGIPNPLPLSWMHTAEEHEAFSEDKALAGVLEAYPTLDFAPGEKYAYSNLSYWLLGKVIEKASGRTYNNFMREEIFEPLGITQNELGCEIPDLDQHARGHQKRFSILTLFFWMMSDSKIWDESAGGWSRFQNLYMNGASYGGMNATAHGYAKFLQAMLRPDPVIFSADTRSQFFESQTDSSGRAMPTTLGWHRGQVQGHEYFGKCGGGPGYSSNIRIYPKDGIATVYLCNKMENSEHPINDLSNRLDVEFLHTRK